MAFVHSGRARRCVIDLIAHVYARAGEWIEFNAPRRNLFTTVLPINSVIKNSRTQIQPVFRGVL